MKVGLLSVIFAIFSK